MSSSLALSRFGHAAVLAILLIAPVVGDRYLQTVLISVLMLFVMGALFDFMLGYLNIVNFGMAGFLCAGAYAAGLSAFHFDASPWIGLLLGGVGGLALGLLTGILTLHLRGVYVGLTTLFVMEFLRYTLASGRDVTRGMSGLQVETFTPILGVEFQRGQPLTYYYLLLVLAVAIYVCLKVIVGTRFGLLFRAIRDDELGASVLGVRVVRFKILNFAVATAFMGVMGAFYAYYIGILVPSGVDFGIPRTVEILTVAYIGGRGTLWGAFFGALVLIGVQEVFRDLEEWRLVIYGAFLVLVLLVFPRGLAGLLDDVVSRLGPIDRSCTRKRASNKTPGPSSSSSR